MFSTILFVFFIPICILLILIVLLQAGKGGGLAGAFGGGGGGQTFLGARGAADFLSKLTVYLAVGFMLLSLILSLTYAPQRTDTIREKPALAQDADETPAGEATTAPEGTTPEETTSEGTAPDTSQPEAPSADEGNTAPSPE